MLAKTAAEAMALKRILVCFKECGGVGKERIASNELTEGDSSNE